MPAFTGEGMSQAPASATSSYDHLPRKSNDKSLGGVFTLTKGTAEGDEESDQVRAPLKNQHLSNGAAGHGRERSHSKAGSLQSISSAKGRFADGDRRSPTAGELSYSRSAGTERSFANQPNGIHHSPKHSAGSLKVITNGEPFPPGQTHTSDFPSLSTSAITATTPEPMNGEPTEYLAISPNQNHQSSPPTSASYPNPTVSSSSTSTMPRLSHRHTLQVPRTSTTRTSREFSSTTAPSEDVSVSGRFSPTHASNRRASLGLVRRTTRSIASDLHLDEAPQDEDAMRWTEAIRQKRASKRKRKEEEDDDRVIVGTKVDIGHTNWVTAYNMLTGIRFTVSRTNAKVDRELTDADFLAQHKFSFDV